MIKRIYIVFVIFVIVIFFNKNTSCFNTLFNKIFFKELYKKNSSFFSTFTLITSSAMGAGKTSCLIDLVNKKKEKCSPPLVFAPKYDTRHDTEKIISHDGQYINAKKISSIKHAKKLIENTIDKYIYKNKKIIIAIDEIQFFNQKDVVKLVKYVYSLENKNIELLAAGLKLKCNGERFLHPDLFFLATHIITPNNAYCNDNIKEKADFTTVKKNKINQYKENNGYLVGGFGDTYVPCDFKDFLNLANENPNSVFNNNKNDKKK